MIQNCVDIAVCQFQQFLMHIPWHASKWILPSSCLHFLLPVAKRLSKAITHYSGPCNSHAGPKGAYNGQMSNERGSSPRISIATCQYHSTIAPHSFIHVSPHTVAYPRIFFGWGSTNSVEDRGERELGSGDGSPLVRGSGGSCNLVQEISFHTVKFS